MQDYLGLIEKQKENAKIFNDYMIEARNSADLAQKVFYATPAAELKESCDNLRTICQQVMLSAELLTSILLVPDPNPITTDEVQID